MLGKLVDFSIKWVKRESMIAKLASEIEEEITQMIYETYETTTTRLTSEELA